ncbi:hypothetical protein [Nocardia yunnanensis]|uniref:hypothetical protein n=1 Tax=Nocardia yunnanensis TaxID=2382165 RepID=UPI0013C4BA0C|nr:hypothetical protein [Nocardia yunnanensis]
MTDTATDTDTDKLESTAAPDPVEHTGDSAAVDPKPLPAKSFGERAFPLAAAVAAVFAVVAVVLGVCWHHASQDYTALKSSASDRDRAAEVAKEYTLRSLTYDYRNLPAFFDGVQRGTSDALRDRYTQVHDTLAKIMTDAQVVATGEVVGTSVEAKGNDQYTVTVYATQKTQNVQQQDPATVPNLLVLTVAKNGGDWVVTDYGPKDLGVKGGAAK